MEGASIEGASIEGASVGIGAWRGRSFVGTLGAALVLVVLSACGGCSSPPPGEGKTYVLVHGAWMGSAGWGPVADKLRADGATVRTLDLPAHGADTTPASAATLVGYVDRVSAELDDVKRPVILVGHSMAGMVISRLAERRPADIRSVVYVAAYLPTTNQALLDLAMTDTDSKVGPSLQFNNDGTVGVAQDKFPDLFCADCTPAARTTLVGSYRVEPAAPLGTKVTLTAASFGSVRKTYIHTAMDQVVSPSLQARMVAATPVDRELTLPTSHVPLLSDPDELEHALLAE